MRSNRWPCWQLPVDDIKNGIATLPDGTKAEVLQETKLGGSCEGTSFVIIAPEDGPSCLEDVLQEATAPRQVFRNLV